MSSYLFVRIGLGRPSGQDRRPDLRRGAGRHPGPGQACPRGLRNHGQDRCGDRGRRGHHHRVGGHRGAGAQGDQRHRLRQLERRLRRPHLRDHQHARQAVARHQPGRGPQEPRAAGRRRPGPDVRLRLHRGAGIHARPAVLQPPAGGAAGQGAQERPAQVAAARRQEPGDPALQRRRQSDRRPGRGGALDPARSGHQAGRPGRGGARAHPQAGAAEEVACVAPQEQGAHQPATNS